VRLRSHRSNQEEVFVSPGKIPIDTTLRAGEQSPGLALQPVEAGLAGASPAFEQLFQQEVLA
jgi:hypothetical protein